MNGKIAPVGMGQTMYSVITIPVATFSFGIGGTQRALILICPTRFSRSLAALSGMRMILFKFYE